MTNELTKLYVIERPTEDGESNLYYMGKILPGMVRWTKNIKKSFFFNHEPRKWEIVNILEDCEDNIGISDINIKELEVEIKYE